MKPETLRLALPSKGRLAEASLELLSRAGLPVEKENPRQYFAAIPNLPAVGVVFQRPGDIVVSVRAGSVDFGITGGDVLAEKRGQNGQVISLHPALGFGFCTLNVIVPESWSDINDMTALSQRAARVEKPLRVATKFPNVSRQFFSQYGMPDIEWIHSEGALETAPAIGYADLVIDLVSTGITLRDNRLKRLADGEILASQACLIANRRSLQSRPAALAAARQLLEYITAHLRAEQNVSLFANIRGASAAAIAERMFAEPGLDGLQGPTISPVITRQGGEWYAAHLIVRKARLAETIASLRSIGGSGVVVTPVSYIFEEEPAEYRRMLAALGHSPSETPDVVTQTIQA